MLTGQAKTAEHAEMILRGIDPGQQQNDDQYGQGSDYAKEQGFGLDLEWDGENDMRHGNAIGEVGVLHIRVCCAFVCLHNRVCCMLVPCAAY
jgi:hypothetical protein